MSPLPQDLRAAALFEAHRESIFRRTDRLFAALMVAQWAAGILLAIWISPLTWAGKERATHPHVWTAVGLGSLITFFPMALALVRPGKVFTRHTVAAGQMLWSALLIHLTGGRIETHFHVFGSLAFLAFYRDWAVLVTATVVVAADHLLRGYFWPESVYGIIVRSDWRWLEHAGWVLFEGAFLVPSCLRGTREMKEIALRQAETEAGAERRYETLVNSMDGVVWEYDPAEDRVSFVSPQAARLLGYPVKEWTARAGFWKDRIHPQDRDRILGWLASNAWMEGSHELEYRLVRADGRAVWIRDSGTMICEEGKPRLRRGILTDVTRIKLQEEELRKSEQRFRHVVQQAADGLFVHDLEGRFVDVNDEACRSLGYSRTELLSRTVADIAVDSQGVEPARRWKALEPGRPITVEGTLRRKDGTAFPAEVRLGVIESEGRTLVLGMARDVSERRKLDQMKNEFISTVSHELRTPLTSIRGSLGLVCNGVTGKIDAKTRAMIEIASKNCDRLVSLVNDILDIEKVASGKMVFRMRSVQVDSLLGQVIAAALPFAESLGVEIRLACEAPGSMITVDSDRLGQVVTNLISNACKFSPRGGRVTVSLTKSDGRVRVSVSDLGAGISEEFRPRIFQRFAQAEAGDNSQKKGTGLGLAISKAFVERMNGTIGFDSVPGKGATFRVEFPEKRLEAAPAGPVSGRPRILVCEDERDIAEILRNTLDHQGFDTDVASTLQEARTLLAGRRYDAMTLDLVLPDGSAVPFIRELRKTATTERLPIIVVSACLDDGQQELGGQAFGIVDWIEKPIASERLSQALAVIHKNSNGQCPKILHVEDDADIREVVRGLLQDTATVDHAGTVMEAWEKLKAEDYDLLLLDLNLPDGSGLELLPSLRKSTGTPLPSLIFSAHEVSPRTARYVSAALLKSRTSNEELLRRIRSLLQDSVLTGGPGRDQRR